MASKLQLLSALQVIDITYDVSAGPEGLLPAIKDVCEQAQVCASGCAWFAQLLMTGTEWFY